jgi:excisionase family DNA binding protein
VTGVSPTLFAMTSTRLLRPSQVAALLGVARQTVHDYESQGRLQAQRTPGGHRRYPADQPALQAALAAQDAP